MRVQIPVHTDRWMMGDRYGAVVKIAKQSHSKIAKKHPGGREIAHVLLDKSGQVRKYFLDECEVI